MLIAILRDFQQMMRAVCAIMPVSIKRCSHETTKRRQHDGLDRTGCSTR